MTVDVWNEVLKSYGVLGVLVAFGIWFFSRRFWPWLIKRFEEYEAERAQTQKEFLAALARHDEGYREMSESFRRFGEKLTEQLAARTRRRKK